MKSAIAYFFLLVFSASYLNIYYVSNLETMVTYLRHKEEITAKFCVNKDKPAMHCDGKCYLRKQLNKGHDNRKQPENIIQRSDIHLICQSLTPISFQRFYTQNLRFPPYGKHLADAHRWAIFHPPIIS